MQSDVIRPEAFARGDGYDKGDVGHDFGLVNGSNDGCGPTSIMLTTNGGIKVTPDYGAGVDAQVAEFLSAEGSSSILSVKVESH